MHCHLLVQTRHLFVVPGKNVSVTLDEFVVFFSFILRQVGTMKCWPRVVIQGSLGQDRLRLLGLPPRILAEPAVFRLLPELLRDLRH